MVEDVVKKAIELYNRYRSPEAQAELVSVLGEEVVLVFRGSFCKTCGVLDWIEDFCYVVEDLGLECKLESATELEEGAWAAKFRVWRG